MKIKVNCFSHLGLFVKGDGVYEVPIGSSVDILPGLLGFSGEEVAMYFVGEERVEPGHILNDGDSVKIFPAITGG